MKAHPISRPIWLATLLLLPACSGGSSDGDSGNDVATDSSDAGSDAEEVGVILPAELDFPPANPADVTPHDDLNLLVSRTRAVVMLFEGDEDGAAVAADLGATVAGSKPDLGIFLFTIRDPGDHSQIDALVEALRADERVAAACHDFVLSTGRIPAPNAPYRTAVWHWQGMVAGTTPTIQDDQNWNLEVTRIPAAWNLRDDWSDGTRSATVVVGDVDFVPDADLVIHSYYGAPDGREWHGTAVAGVIAASWDNGQGFDGVVPGGLRLMAVPFRDLTEDELNAGQVWAQVLDGVERSLEAFAPVDVYNISMGADWDRNGTTLGFDPGAQPASQRSITDAAAQFVRIVQASEVVSPNLFFTIAAGNASGDDAGTPDREPIIDSRWGSPMCYAFETDLLENGLCVAAVDPGLPLAPADYSNRPAEIYAPGSQVGLLGADTGIDSGTSFAAPLVAGVAALIRLVRPEASAADLFRGLTIGASPLGGAVAPMLDAFEAFLVLEGAEATYRRTLADVDDATPDGCRRAVLDDRGQELFRDEEDFRGDGVVDMADFRRLRDVHTLVYRAAEGLNGFDPGPGTLHPKMDANLDGGRTEEPERSLGTPGQPPYQWENVWSRFDLNGDGILDDGTPALTMGGEVASDLLALANVWGSRDDDAARDPDLEGWERGTPAETASLLQDLMHSADVEVRLANMFADERYAAVAVEVHVWPDGEEEPARGEESERSRQLERGEAFPANLVFTAPVPEDGGTLNVSAYYVINPSDTGTWVGAEVTPESEEELPELIANLEDVGVAEDHVVVFGPVPQTPSQRYVWYWFDSTTLTADVRVVGPNGPGDDLLDDIPYFEAGGGPPGITCSPTGSHVGYRSDTDGHVYTYDGQRYTYELPDDGVGISGSSPAFTDDLQTMVWIEEVDDVRRVWRRNIETGEEVSWGPWEDFEPATAALSLSADGSAVLLSNGGIAGYTAGADWLSPGVWPANQRVLFFSSGALEPAYERTLSTTCGQQPYDARVQVQGANFLQDGRILFATDEQLLTDAYRSCAEPGYDPPGDAYIIELGISALRGTEVQYVTSYSGEAAGGVKVLPVLSPNGAEILYLNYAGGVGSELRWMRLGANGGVVIQRAPSALSHIFGACWLRD